MEKFLTQKPFEAPNIPLALGTAGAYLGEILLWIYQAMYLEKQTAN